MKIDLILVDLEWLIQPDAKLAERWTRDWSPNPEGFFCDETYGLASDILKGIVSVFEAYVRVRTEHVGTSEALSDEGIRFRLKGTHDAIKALNIVGRENTTKDIQSLLDYVMPSTLKIAGDLSDDFWLEEREPTGLEWQDFQHELVKRQVH